MLFFCFFPSVPVGKSEERPPTTRSRHHHHPKRVLAQQYIRRRETYGRNKKAQQQQQQQKVATWDHDSKIQSEGFFFPWSKGRDLYLCLFGFWLMMI